jgi:uncharacterized membrane protein YdcZ (DUF606 family)
VQVAVMGRFGDRIGVLEALTFATIVQLVLAVCILVAARLGSGNLGEALNVPKWLWAGGAIGLLVVLTISSRNRGSARPPRSGS